MDVKPSPGIQPHRQWAFKEWAVICDALAEGRQIAIVRKGGIHEGRDGFRVAHGEFWLLPTYLHQTAEAMASEAEPLLKKVLDNRPAEGVIQIRNYAVVKQVFEFKDLAEVQAIAGQHIWSPQTIEQRFHYRQPGLFVLAVHVFQIPTPYELAETQQIAGCRSWVELPQELSTAGAEPVISEGEFAERWELLRSSLKS